MNYKLIGSNDISDIKHTILKNRGVKDIEKYLSLDDSVLYHYSLLDNINEGVELLKKSIEDELKIYVIVDCDFDGFSSAGMIYDYIKTYLNYNNITHLLHENKQHGLSNKMMKDLTESEAGLLIIPDAGTNDTKQCKKLNELGFKILVLDHHLKEKDNPHALIINNQTCNYPNKSLCGAGVVYKFLQALDDECWIDGADNYLDMVAFANVADIMDLREHETMHLVNKGLCNIKHPLLEALLKRQSYSVSNIERPTSIDIAFFISPLINAMVRVGKQDEKEMMFRAFTKQCEEFEYKPRKSKNNPEPKIIMESIYDRVARLCANTRSRQAKVQGKLVDEVISIYDDFNKKNSICIINSSRINGYIRELSGLLAIKVASKYGKPCLVIKKDENENKKDVTFSGSGRNINDGYIDDLSSELESTGLFESIKGHANAFGVSIKKDNIEKVVDYFNTKYSGENSNRVYKVDFEFNENVEYSVIKNIYDIKYLFSSFIKEPLIAIKNVNVDLLGFDEFGSGGKKHWKFQNDVVEYIKFNVDEDDDMLNIDTFSHSSATIDVIGRVGINTFGGKVVPQVVVENYIIKDMV